MFFPISFYLDGNSNFIYFFFFLPNQKGMNSFCIFSVIRIEIRVKTTSILGTRFKFRSRRKFQCLW